MSRNVETQRFWVPESGGGSMKILCTGSEGSLMQAVIPRLLKQGFQVRGVDMAPKRKPQDRRYEFIQGDLSKSVQFAVDVTQGMDAVIHAAATVQGVAGISDIKEEEKLIIKNPSIEYKRALLTPGAKMGFYLREAVRKNNIKRTCFISSSCVYDLSHDYARRNLNLRGLPEIESEVNCEAMEVQPKNPRRIRTYYSLHKLIQECLWANRLPHEKTTAATCVVWRPFNIIGPEPPKSASQGRSHVFVDFVRNVVVKKLNPLPIIGDGYQVRCFTWIDDVAEAIAKYTFRHPATKDGGTFNVGNPQPITMRQLAEMIYHTAQNLGLLKKTNKTLGFKTVAEYSGDIRYRLPDINKIRSLGWEPKVGIEEAIEKLLSNNSWLESL